MFKNKIFVYFILSLMLGWMPLSYSIDTSTLAQKYYSYTTKAYQEKDWRRLLSFSERLHKQFSSSPFAQEALYYKSVALFHLKKYQKANFFLSECLQDASSSKFYFDALNYKFEIAEKFRTGTKIHLFGMASSPKILDGKEEALIIYDELINTLPYEELAAKAMFSKGLTLSSLKEYTEAIEAYELLIRTFPRHELAIEAFLEIQKAYLCQVSPKRQESDLLDLAQINIRKFEQAFPSEERIEEAKKNYHDMQEIYAQGLYEIGRFFERTKRKEAAKIYYSRIVQNFSNTKFASLSRGRLDLLKKEP